MYVSQVQTKILKPETEMSAPQAKKKGKEIMRESVRARDGAQWNR
jgi:hypothetical protein